MKEVYNNVAGKWNPIGVFLGISDGELNTIAEREHGDSQVCLMGILRVWLLRPQPLPSWPEVADAVDFTGRPELHKKLDRYTVSMVPLEMAIARRLFVYLI